jgi:4-amino-4-deoxy-L-arabinose transferase-like glycosyltransferase
VTTLFTGPAYPDAYYYAHIANQFASGHGLVSDYLWNLDDLGGSVAGVVNGLPVAANGYWMPLTELVQVPFVALLGATAFAASLPFVLIGAAVAPLTFWIGRDAGLSVSHAAAAGGLAAVPMGLTPFVVQPDNFALFMFLAALSLWLCARGARGDVRAFVLGGLIVGLATLTRVDGVLLGLPFAVVFLGEVFRGRAARVTWSAALACLALFVLVLGPWLLRQVQIFGAPLPADGSRVVWLTDYQQLFSFADPPTLDGWLAQGVGGIVTSRVAGLLAALGLFAVVCLGVVFVPFAIVGAWIRRHDANFQPLFPFGIALLAVSALLLPVLVTHGTFLHGAAALVPHTLLLVVVGIDAVVRWLADRRAHWNADRAARSFVWAAVFVTLLVAGVQTLSTAADWSAARSNQQQLVAALAAVPLTDRFMAADPGAINYLTGRQGILTPADDLTTIEAVIREYDVRWLILERDSIVPALTPVLAGEARPEWLSAPVATTPGGAVYAVCLAAEDGRCNP